MIAKTHDTVKELYLFAAVPAAIAVACGQELLPNSIGSRRPRQR